MNIHLSEHIPHLSVPERLNLIDDLWSSVKQTNDFSDDLLNQVIEDRYQHSIDYPNAPTTTLSAIAERLGIRI